VVCPRRESSQQALTGSRTRPSRSVERGRPARLAFRLGESAAYRRRRWVGSWIDGGVTRYVIEEHLIRNTAVRSRLRRRRSSCGIQMSAPRSRAVSLPPRVSTRESFDAYGSKKSFEWQQVENEEPMITRAALRRSRSPRLRFRAASACPTYARLLPEPIQRFTQPAAIQDASICRSFRAADMADRTPHLVQQLPASMSWRTAGHAGRRNVGELDDGRDLRASIGRCRTARRSRFPGSDSSSVTLALSHVRSVSQCHSAQSWASADATMARQSFDITVVES